MSRVDFGICAYRDAVKLVKTVEHFRQNTTGEWRLLIVDNPAEGSTTRDVIEDLCALDSRITARLMERNVGYAGAVNEVLGWAETLFVGYLDHDAYVMTPGWNERLTEVMEANPELGWMFPGPGHYGFHNGRYNECLWSAGYCWIIRREAVDQVQQKRPAQGGGGILDTELGHHEEVDLMIRLRLAGWRVGCRPDVQVHHDETATRADDANHKPGGRIHDGVVRWMNRWNGYFCGDELQYSMTAYDPRALRYTDWNVDALYLERFTLHHFPQLNARPETVNIPGVGEMDVIKVLKPKGCYVGRAI